ncbi:uncharacterized protein V1516DRAFT_678978 [Lipomyces oligophaga]|uniref:uncharacterized protein n=1 Tax=Lipomyces oligophaga TaxID=45792 RepID=UPI0034CFF94A
MIRLSNTSSTAYVIGALLSLFVVHFLFFSSNLSAADMFSPTASNGDAPPLGLSAADLRTAHSHYQQVVSGAQAPLRDTFDAFQEYKYRDICRMSSLDLHQPFEPLCKDRESLLTAMSSGGRIGMDAPYMPRDCDMRWYTTEEACSVLEKFDRVSIVGDSMMRQMLGALYVILRKNLGYGGVTDWNFSDQEKADCFCNAQVNVKSCSMQTIYSSKDIIKWDPNSFACDPKKVNILMNLQVRFPQPEDEIKRYAEDLGGVPENAKVAFIYGHGLWNDLDVQATLNFLERSESGVKFAIPGFQNGNPKYPKLFITPNAAGPRKQDSFILTQGNKPLMMFEQSMYTVLPERGFDVLGTWNMSIQSLSLDGVHCDIRGNLIKAQMLLNWLDKVGSA